MKSAGSEKNCISRFDRLEGCLSTATLLRHAILPGTDVRTGLALSPLSKYAAGYGQCVSGKKSRDNPSHSSEPVRRPEMSPR